MDRQICFELITSMKWSNILLAVYMMCNYIPGGTPALSKAALESTKKMMKGMCKRNSGVSQELLTRLGNGEFVDDQKLKCYVHCCFGMMKTMKGDKITVAEATKQAEMLLPRDLKEATLKQLNACKDTEGPNSCEKAYNFLKCCNEFDAENWLVPI